MNKIVKLSFLILAIVFMSCHSKETIPTNSTTCEEDTANLGKLFNEITAISESKPCTDASKWRFVAFGTKACGGPVGFIAYSSEINVNDFLSKIKEYTDLQNQMNKKCGIISDCSIPPTPKGIVSENNKPIFIY